MWKIHVTKWGIYLALTLGLRALIGWLGVETVFYFAGCIWLSNKIDDLFAKPAAPKIPARLVLHSDGTWDITAPCETNETEKQS
jgi:hypothetical protein